MGKHTIPKKLTGKHREHQAVKQTWDYQNLQGRSQAVTEILFNTAGKGGYCGYSEKKATVLPLVIIDRSPF